MVEQLAGKAEPLLADGLGFSRLGMRLKLSWNSRNFLRREDKVCRWSAKSPVLARTRDSHYPWCALV